MAPLVSAFGAGPVAVLAWETDGFSSIGMRLGSHDVEPDPLAAGLALTNRIRISSQHSGEYNELSIAPRSLRTEGTGSMRACQMEGALSDYAAYRASMSLWSRLSLRQRARRCVAGLPGLRPHRVGVATALTCSDGTTVLLRREESTSWYPGAWAVPAEGAQAEDLVVGEDGVPAWNPARTALRGLGEEVGVHPAEVSLTFSGVVIEVATGIVSVVARAEVMLSGAELLEAIGSSPDGGEHTGSVVLPWSIPSLRDEIPSFAPMVPNHAFALVAAAALDLGQERCRREGWLSDVPLDSLRG